MDRLTETSGDLSVENPFEDQVHDDLDARYADSTSRKTLEDSSSSIISTAPIYTPLDPNKLEIRLLTLLPGQDGSIVCCEMQKTTLIDDVIDGSTRIKYTALSYYWGDDRVRTKIIINDKEIQVTVNLAHALAKLRKLGTSSVWADAVCINQDDQHEKSEQIRIMKLVYERADQTYVWLGLEEILGLEAAMSFFGLATSA